MIAALTAGTIVVALTRLLGQASRMATMKDNAGLKR
ncbi:hypothetical protein J2S69_004529 [Glycomyces lechevalierae]|uniref:Uncharacterized protein n=1 Tax=Glycomyces lechevalierae TaxID=256034 RepID=A0ABU2AUV0_9ACTN|nr:hypothetical protein [Glycomyces lechevalierae]